MLNVKANLINMLLIFSKPTKFEFGQPFQGVDKTFSNVHNYFLAHFTFDYL